MKAKKVLPFALLSVLTIMLVSLPIASYAAAVARLSTLVRLSGQRENQLTGFGLVVGLNGTGDSRKSGILSPAMKSFLVSQGVNVAMPKQINPDNVAVVEVTAKLPSYARAGDKINITIASVGDAKSLEGGILMTTYLKAGNHQTYAVGQGALLIGGKTGAGRRHSSRRHGERTPELVHPTVATIPGGAIVEADVISNQLEPDGSLLLLLKQPDYVTAARVSSMINSNIGPGIAKAEDAQAIRVKVPAASRNQLVPFISKLMELKAEPNVLAKIIVNERTGTVLAGGDISISECVIMQGNLKVVIKKRREVQERDKSGATLIKTVEDIERHPVSKVSETTTVSELATYLNRLGASPGELVAILQAMKNQGALHAELEIM